MGGGSTKKLFKDIGTAALVGTAATLGGPALLAATGGALGTGTAGALALGATRAASGKNILGSDISPKIPDAPVIPEPPGADGEEERLRQKAILDRIRRAAFTGQGRRATIATGGQGVTGQSQSLRRTAARII